ncbi:MAG: hypothetical protein ABJD13_13440 [Paracoccaceae bacterium]
MNTACLAHFSKETPINAPYRTISINEGGPVIGYHVAGRKVGPNLLVAAQTNETNEVFRRLLSIPTLPWLRGNLFLLRLDNTRQSIAQLMPKVIGEHLTELDGQLLLTGRKSANAGYWTILRFCTHYGMISGRGVPAPALAKADAVR